MLVVETDKGLRRVIMTFSVQGLPGKVNVFYLITWFETEMRQERSLLSASLCSGSETGWFLPSLNIFLFRGSSITVLSLAKHPPAFVSQVYHECSCVEKTFLPSPGNAEAGKCTSSCAKRPLLLLFMFVVILFTFLSSIPALTATLR